MRHSPSPTVPPRHNHSQGNQDIIGMGHFEEGFASANERNRNPDRKSGVFMTSFRGR